MTEEWIYCLRDRVNGAIFYVGRSTVPAQRIRDHGCWPDWMRSLLKPDTRQVGTILETCSNHAEAKLAEQRWIDDLEYAGARLLNVQGVVRIGRKWIVANMNHKAGDFASDVLAG